MVCVNHSCGGWWRTYNGNVNRGVPSCKIPNQLYFCYINVPIFFGWKPVYTVSLWCSLFFGGAMSQPWSPGPTWACPRMGYSWYSYHLVPLKNDSQWYGRNIKRLPWIHIVSSHRWPSSLFSHSKTHHVWGIYHGYVWFPKGCRLVPTCESHPLPLI